MKKAVRHLNSKEGCGDVADVEGPVASTGLEGFFKEQYRFRR
jgi:hypothetical protein